MIKVIVCGVGGRMGASLTALLQGSKEISLLGGIESANSPLFGTPVGESICTDDLNKIIGKSDLLIDFSQPEVTLKNLPIAVRHQKPIVIGTTGFSPEQKKEIKTASKKIPICLSPNMSIGMNVLFRLVSEAARLLKDDYDVEVIEAHHRFKKDAPSGTAMKISEILVEALSRNLMKDLRFHREGLIGERNPKEIGMQTIRGGDIVGDHTVMFAGQGERLEITHRATSRDNFARGALLAAKWLVKQKPGLYDMQDLLGLK